ncbi:MAG TPA: bifunctional ornithine acetyltransferase/N-acetylglutamate synthase [Herpetosiphonaceae bacterium]
MPHTLVPDGSIATPGGLRMTGIHCGLKPTRDRDLGLVVSRAPCAAALHVPAQPGPVDAWTKAALGAKPQLRAVLTFSGCAAGTPAEAEAVCRELAAALADEAAIKPEQVAILAAGSGPALDLDVLRKAVPRALDELDSKGDRRLGLALALDDTPYRAAAAELALGAATVQIGGIAAGGRALIASNANLSSPLLQRALDAALAAQPAWQAATVLVLAHGAAQPDPIARAASAEFKAWQAALAAVLENLAAA